MKARNWVYTVLFASGISTAPVASAWVNICNDTGSKITAAVAIASKGASGVSTSHSSASVHGWFSLAPGACGTAFEVNANEQYMYFYAKAKGDKEWHGKSRLCVRSQSFKSKQQFLMSGDSCKDDWYEVTFVKDESSSKNFTFHFK